MPAWVHDRAAHIRSKNSDMSESLSWALANQQAHKLGKTPKDYGTAEGKATAKAKYQLPRSEYRKTADRVKKANAALGYTPGAATPIQPAPPVPSPSMRLGQANPMTAAQAQPKLPPPVQITPAQTGPMPTATSGPATMPKTASAVRYQAFFDELCNIELEKEAWDTRLLHPRFAGQRATGALKAVRNVAKKVGFKEAPYVKKSAPGAGASAADIEQRGTNLARHRMNIGASVDPSWAAKVKA